MKLRCKRCGFEIRDNGEDEMTDCTMHPARSKGWKGSTPHDLVAVPEESVSSMPSAADPQGHTCFEGKSCRLCLW